MQDGVQRYLQRESAARAVVKGDGVQGLDPCPVTGPLEEGTLATMFRRQMPLTPLEPRSLSSPTGTDT